MMAILLYPLILPADLKDRHSLFRIERNTNANIVQYDADIGPDGKLNPKEPVVAYWIRLADEGQIKELSWIQKKFAYGFNAKLEKSENTATLEMAANLGRTILVTRLEEEYIAIADINGIPSQLDRLYIHATGKGLSTTVEFIEIYGADLDGGEALYEHFTP